MALGRARAIRLAAAAASLAVCWPATAFAWGRDGHAVVAEIAERQLTPRARAEITKLLALDHVQHLDEVSSWADHVKQEDIVRPAHTVRLSLYTNDIKLDSCPSRFCAVTGIETYLKTLADRRKPAVQRLEALKFVVHLVGDVHQPLHTAQVTGGKVQIMLNGEPTTLHRVWDRWILEANGGPRNGLAERLVRAEGKVSADGTPLRWAIEGRDIARDRIFSCLPPRTKTPIKLDRQYLTDNWPVVRRRLVQGGARLARVLNEAL